MDKWVRDALVNFFISQPGLVAAWMEEMVFVTLAMCLKDQFCTLGELVRAMKHHAIDNMGDEGDALTAIRIGVVLRLLTKHRYILVRDHKEDPKLGIALMTEKGVNRALMSGWQQYSQVQDTVEARHGPRDGNTVLNMGTYQDAHVWGEAGPRINVLKPSTLLMSLRIDDIIKEMNAKLN